QREAEYEESVAKGDQPVVAGEREGEAGLAGKKTIETVKAAERIMEAVELHREESAKLEEHRSLCKAAGKELPRRAHPILQAYGNISVRRGRGNTACIYYIVLGNTHVLMHSVRGKHTIRT
ncbi:WD repeat-containing protein 3, partial [Ascaphus truei]|uniref:WD repeat-containing protein 3 n=1 Tax=Ascaphus truei TaxID=8439 RepID=UPI003F59DF58